MVRAIKFRAWLIDFKTMWHGDDVPTTFTFGKHGFMYAHNKYWDTKDEKVLAAAAIIMQYTGLKDKNGKEIYEGDIVIGAGSRDGGPSGVFFSYGQWQPFSFLGTYAGWEFEVIGNIHQNPELLPRPSKRQEAKG
jgi:hypothetical protein